MTWVRPFVQFADDLLVDLPRPGYLARSGVTGADAGPLELAMPGTTVRFIRLRLNDVLDAVGALDEMLVEPDEIAAIDACIRGILAEQSAGAPEGSLPPGAPRLAALAVEQLAAAYERLFAEKLRWRLEPG